MASQHPSMPSTSREVTLYSEDDSDTSYEPSGDSESDTSSDMDDEESDEPSLSSGDEGYLDEWIDGDGSPPDLPFSGKEEVKGDIDPNIEPIGIFDLLFTEVLLTQIVRETNRRGEQLFDESERRKTKRILRWKETDIEELKKFLGLCLLIGNIKFPSLASYWSTNPLYFHPVFGKIMSRNRFELILSVLRFVDHSNVNINDKLFKIRPVIDELIEKFNFYLSPGQNLSLDEAMILWRGRLSFRQYVIGKRHKFGIKLYELCTPEGYVLNVLVYTGKGMIIEPTAVRHSDAVVHKLLNNYINKGHVVYMDRFYNSVELAEKLIKDGTYICGTINMNRKSNPKDLVVKKIKKGTVATKYKGPVLVTKWKDKRDVLMISTKHRHEMVKTKNKRGVEKEKPKCIVDYNTNMSGIDRADQMTSYYSTPRKTIKWYRKVFFHFLDISLSNGHLLYQRVTGKKIDLLSFRNSIINSLFGNSDNQPSRKRKRSEDHYPEPCPLTGKTALKRCRECHSKGVRKRSRYQCASCEDNPGLCVYPCFMNWHKKN
ncbi:hypothetical protein J437_LFUL010145 [Ladona fulva]|uniref:PiggyBac transposable element-derived protein 4 n=1 Tax=Ladona fulva TaxID=123851 RepID=A0A8K0K656_LADFU|nr:hypothetical protein J437_LFUL010145 [Ladona fulva]